MLQSAKRDSIPRSTHEVSDWVATLGFSSNLLREMRSIAQARRYAGARRWWCGRLERRLARLRFHLIEPHEQLAASPHASKYDARAGFLERLHEIGRDTVQEWLQASAASVGRRATLNR